MEPEASAKINSDRYIHVQNLIRGALSQLKGRDFKANIKDTSYDIKRMHSSRRAVVNAFSSARELLPVERFDEFIQWANKLIQESASELLRAEIGFDNLLRFREKVHAQDLGRELAWAAARIRGERDTLNLFRALAAEVQEFILDGKYEEARGRLDVIDTAYGVSFWSLQLRIGLEHLTGGLEAQKQLVGSLRTKFKRNMISFIAYYTGVRNEDRTTWDKFVNKVRELRPSLLKRRDATEYVAYRLTSLWPREPKKIAEVLAFEQGHGIIDLYESMISCIQNLLRYNHYTDLRNQVEAACKSMDVNDFRIIAILKSIDPAQASECREKRDCSVADALLSEQPLRAIRLYRTLPSVQRNDPWQMIYAAISANYLDMSWPSSARFATLRLLTAALRQEQSSGRGLQVLEKFAVNFGGLSFASSLRDFVKAVEVIDGPSYLPQWWVSLNCQLSGIESGAQDLGHTYGASQAARFWYAFYGKKSGMGDQDDFATRFAAARSLFEAGAFQDAADLLENTNDSAAQNGIMVQLAARLMVVCYMRLENDDMVISTIACSVADNSSTALLPLREALAGFQWRQFKRSIDDLSAAIALHALWSLSGEDEIATMLRMAFSLHLKRSSLRRPSELADGCKDDTRRRLSYYLRYVCVPNFMDMSLAFSSSREVIEERSAICASLKQLDPDNSVDYDSEIYGITNQLVIADGLKLVDTSRIYVDTSALSRWARQELQEDYDRYHDLSKLASASTRDFDELLRELFATIGARQIFFTPDSTSDALLTDVVIRMRNEFLQNSDYGLDYFLSKRVRHQSFIGLLRGPLEFENLITNRESEFGAYRPNQYVSKSLSACDADIQRNVQSHLAHFSERFDGALAAVKDLRLQIKDSEHPSGVFDIALNSRSLFTINSLAQTGLSFNDFLRVLYQVFWSGLEPSLAVARKTVAEDLKGEICELFDTLRAALRSSIPDDGLFATLSSSIGHVSAEVQRNLDEVAAWFVRPEAQSSGHQFTLRQCVEIAVQSALKSHRAFEPEIEIEVYGEYDLQAPDLLILTDAIFIALDNVRLHNGVKKGSKVRVRCGLDDADYIRLGVESAVSSHVDQVAAEAKLSRIRSLIDAGNFGKIARKEGGSGFLKIAAALKHSADGTLDFGFRPDDIFSVQLRLRPTLYTVAVMAA